MDPETFAEPDLSTVRTVAECENCPDRLVLRGETWVHESTRMVGCS